MRFVKDIVPLPVYKRSFRLVLDGKQYIRQSPFVHYLYLILLSGGFHSDMVTPVAYHGRSAVASEPLATRWNWKFVIDKPMHALIIITFIPSMHPPCNDVILIAPHHEHRATDPCEILTNKSINDYSIIDEGR